MSAPQVEGRRSGGDHSPDPDSLRSGIDLDGRTVLRPAELDDADWAAIARRNYEADPTMADAVADGHLDPAVLDEAPAPAPAPDTAQPEAPEPVTSRIVTAAELAMVTPETVEYVARPYVVAGAVTELSAPIKAGKTEFTMRLAAAVATGRPFLGYDTRRAPVLYLSEQLPRVTRRYLERADVLDCVDLALLFRYDAGEAEWPDLCAELAPYVAQCGIGLVVVDTLSDWSGLTGDNENAAGAALAAMRPLQALAAAGAAVVAVRHQRKGGGTIGESARGSSAFGGAADVLVKLERDRIDGHESRRVLEAVGRFDDIPAKVVVDLAEDGYELLGDARELARRAAERQVLDVLPTDRELALDRAAIHELVEDIGASTIRDLLAGLVAAGTVQRERGAGCASPRAFGYWSEA